MILAKKPELSEPKNAVFDPKMAIFIPMTNINPALLFSNSTWDIGTKITFTLKIMILAHFRPTLANWVQ